MGAHAEAGAHTRRERNLARRSVMSLESGEITTLATPKSHSLTLKPMAASWAAVAKKLSGLMSRCAMPAA